MKLQFGVFDHVDRGSLGLSEYYEERLRLAEIYDRAGFYCYHVAEHHSTPLGMAASPSVFLAAISQRTRNLRFGPLVYLLPLYHPLRLLEEICMLDHLSRGRMQIGVGRGISPIESGFFGVQDELRQGMYEEALEILVKGLTNDAVSFTGKFYDYRNVPMELQPLQRPHPPLWMGVQSTGGAQFAARRGANIVSLLPASAMKAVASAYREASPASGPGEERRVGLSYFVVVGESDSQAMDTASAAYERWHRSFNHLYRMHGRGPVLGKQPSSFAEAQQAGRGIAGSPDTVLDFLRDQIRQSGINYLVGQFAFGDMPAEDVRQSVESFSRHVMGPLRESAEGR